MNGYPSNQRFHPAGPRLDENPGLWLEEAADRLQAADELAGRQARNIAWQLDLIGAQGDALLALHEELVDIDHMTAILLGKDVPLRDRVAVLVAQWEDVAASLDGILPSSDYNDQLAAMRRRAGLDG